MYPYFNNSYMAFGSLMMLLFWGVAIIGIVALVRWLIREGRDGRNNSTSSNNALEILKTRYAKGEINKEEFEAKKKDLDS